MEQRSIRVVLLTFLVSLLAGCQPGPRIEVRESIALGESPALQVTGLAPGQLYTLCYDSRDVLGRRWTSQASFRADALGTVDLARQEPEEGDYSGIDEFGLFWSATMPEPPADDWQAPEPLPYNEVTIRLERQGSELVRSSLRQWVRPPDLRSEVWDEGAVAELFLPAESAEPLPALVLLGGSGGGRSWATRTAALLAEQGFAALALAYFDAPGLPEHLAEIPVESVFGALDRLTLDPRVDPDRIGLLGYSKGAELALVVASRRPDVRAVVAIAPGSAVFQGFKPPRFPTISSWSLGGEGLTFVPNAYDKKFFETFDGMYLWYRTLSQHGEVAAAAIAVEEIRGGILLLSGVEDRIWPATYMAEQIVARLYLSEFPYPVKHLAFPEAGHGIAAPPGEPTTGVASRLGGTASGNAAARIRSWRAIREFLSTSLRGAVGPSRVALLLDRRETALEEP